MVAKLVFGYDKLNQDEDFFSPRKPTIQGLYVDYIIYN